MSDEEKRKYREEEMILLAIEIEQQGNNEMEVSSIAESIPITLTSAFIRVTFMNLRPRAIGALLRRTFATQ